MHEVRIIVEHISKVFIERKQSRVRFIHVIINLLRRSRGVKKEVIRDVSFSAQAGENIGIIGKNGSGKSTLLRMVSGIYPTDSGSITCNGSVIYLTGFNQGLQEELTMRENIFYIGALMGLSKADIQARFDDIVQFSGLEENLDHTLGTFSSGMVSRLSFSIGVFCIDQQEPDILLIDEIGFGGGGADLEFRQQSKDKVQVFLERGATVLLVSHDLQTIEKYCHRVIWLEDGVIKCIGNPKEVCDTYRQAYSAQ